MSNRRRMRQQRFLSSLLALPLTPVKKHGKFFFEKKVKKNSENSSNRRMRRQQRFLSSLLALPLTPVIGGV